MTKNHLIPRLGAKSISSLTPDDLNSVMIDMMKAGKSVTTVRYLLRIVHRVLDDAVRKGKLVRNVADLADPPPARKAETSVWNEKQLDIFLTAAAKFGQLYELFSLLVLTGERVSEGLGGQWQDLDLYSDQPTLSVRRTEYKLFGQWQTEKPKTDRSRRVIELPMALALLLRRLREQQEAMAEWAGRKLMETDYIFARENGTRPDRHHVSKVFHKIVERAGLPRIRLHDLRHTLATLLRKNGRSIEEISKLLGHASTVVTATIYNHWMGESRAVADTTDKILEKAEIDRTKEAFVSKMLAESEELASRPYRSRTCDTLIKSQIVLFGI